MKKVIILFAAILVFAANSFAQTGAQTDNQAAPKKEKRMKPNGKGGQHAGANIKKELNLTPEQEARLKDMGAINKGKIQAVRTDNSLSKEQKRAQMMEIQKAHDAEVKGILNADQYNKFTELKKQRRENMKGRKSK